MQVTVQKIWPLDPTKKSGGFKGTDGVNYYCEIGAYHLVQEGATYEANARPYVSKATGKSSFIMPKEWHPPATLVGGTSAPNPQPTNTAQPTPPRPTANGAASPPYFSEVEKSGYIFVTGCMQQALSSAKYDTQDIPLLAQALVEAWNTHIKAKV